MVSPKSLPMVVSGVLCLGEVFWEVAVDVLAGAIAV
jgi:hypothetical protein